MKLVKFREKDNKKLSIIIFTVSCVFLIAGVFLYKTFASFEVTDSLNIIEGTVQDVGDLYFAFYINDLPSTTMPTKTDGFIYDDSKSSCTNGASIEWNNDTWSPKVLNFTESRTKCTLYFKVYSAVDTITALAESGDTSLVYDGTVDNNIRYIGANPNNYVNFNHELWRIIGVMNNISDGNRPSRRLKIIRNETLGNYSWDSSASTVNGGNGVNEWSQADIKTLLNELYYEANAGSCMTNSNEASTACDFTATGLTDEAAKNMIDYVVWHTGSNGTSTYTSAANGLASHFYGYERGNETGKICTSGDNCNDEVERTVIWSGNIGLMYPSDYGYATAGGATTNRDSCLAKELYNWDDASYTDCKDNNWLYDSAHYQWTMTPLARSSNASPVFRINNTASVRNYNAYSPRGIRPTVYLKPHVKIDSGDGTQENAYIISA